MKYSISILLLLLTNINLVSQSLFIDSLFSNNGSEIISFDDHQLRNIELFNSNSGEYHIVGLDLVDYGPPVFYVEDYFILGFDNCGNIDSNYGSNGKFSLQEFLAQSQNYTNMFHIESYGNSSEGDILFSGTLPVYYPSISLSLNSPLLIKVLPHGNVDTNYFYQDISQFFDSLSNRNEASYNYAEVLDDDKILCIGQYSEEVEEGILVCKYQPNGNLDSTFNSIGFKKINFGNLKFAELDVLKSNENEYVIAASHIDSLYPILIKINDEGELVESFGSNGVFADTVNLFFGNKLLELQSDKILLGREFSFDDYGYISLLRYNSNGSPDSTFGSNGKAHVQVSESSMWGTTIGMDVLDNNEILIGYYQYWNGQYGSTLLLEENGSIDSTFATNGRLIHEVSDLFTVYCSAHSITDGRLVLAGITSNSNVILSRFTEENTVPNITLDGSILSSGITSSSIEVQWYLNGELVESSNDNNLEITTPGEYVVVAIDVIECGSVSDTLYIYTVINSSNIINDITINPNPSNSYLFINNLKASNEFVIYNLFGKIVKSGVVSAEKNRIDVTSLENGIYLLMFDGVSAQRIVKN
jgi:uncharacterized delta-60 repeat protein